MLLFQVSPPAPTLSSLQPQAPPATPCLPSLPVARPALSPSAPFPCLPLAHPLPPDGLCCAWAQTQTPMASVGKRTPPWVIRPPALAGGLWARAPSIWKVGQAGRRRRQGTASVSSAHSPLTVIPQGAGYPESSQSQGARLLVKLQLPALQAPSAVCPGGVPDPIAQPQPEALLPSPSSCDTGLLHSPHFPPSVATLLPWVPVISVLTFPFFFGS